MWQTIIMSVIIVALSLVLLAIRIILEKDGKFGSEHVSENKRMHKDGIACATSQDRQARQGNKNRLNINNL